MRLLQSYEKGGVIKKEGALLDSLLIPRGRRISRRHPRRRGRRMSGDRGVAEDLGVLRAGKPNIRALPPPCGRWILLARDEGFFAIFVNDSKTMHHGNSISRLIGLI